MLKCENPESEISCCHASLFLDCKGTVWKPAVCGRFWFCTPPPLPHTRSWARLYLHNFKIVSPLSPPPFKTVFEKKSTSLTFIGIWNLGAAIAVLSINIGLFSIFLCPDKGMATSAFDFNVGSNTLMLPVAHQCCVDTGRVHTGGWLGETSLAAPGTRTHISLAPGFSHQGLELTWVLRLAFHTRGSNPHQSCAWLFTSGARTHISLAPGCSVRHFIKWAVSHPCPFSFLWDRISCCWQWWYVQCPVWITVWRAAVFLAMEFVFLAAAWVAGGACMCAAAELLWSWPTSALLCFVHQNYAAFWSRS